MYIDENSHNRRSSFDDSFEKSAERSGKEFDDMNRQGGLCDLFGDGMTGLFPNNSQGHDINNNEASYQHRTPPMEDRLFGETSSQQPYYNGMSAAPQ